MPTVDDSVLLLCDLQENFRKTLRDPDRVIANSTFAVNSCKELGIPIIVTEHVKKVFGSTFHEFNAEENATAIIQKAKFSMCTDETVRELVRLNKKHVIILGMEAHICIMQTVMELLSRGYHVHMLRDCIVSQTSVNEEVAIARMCSAGACLTTAQSVVFQLVRTAKHPKFRALQRHIKKQLTDLAKL